MKLKKLIRLSQLKRDLAVNEINCELLKSVNEELYNNASAINFSQMLDLIDQVLKLLKIKISADILTDELINQLVDILADYGVVCGVLADATVTDIDISAAKITKQLHNDIVDMLINYRDSN